MKRWLVETQCTSRRFYIVSAEDEKAAIYSSTHLPPEYEYEEFEETIDVTEAVPMVHETCSDCPPIGYPTNKTRCADCERHPSRILVRAFGEEEALRIIERLRSGPNSGDPVFEDAADFIENGLRMSVHTDQTSPMTVERERFEE